MSGKVERICEYCGGEFQVNPSAIKFNRSAFCSKRCFYASTDKRIERVCEYCQSTFKAQADKIHRKFCSMDCMRQAKKQIDCTCENCEKIFQVFASEVRRGNGKFCSKECSRENQRKTIESSCKYCGANFQTIPSRIRRGGGKFCCEKCYTNWKSKNERGENHPLWKGGNIDYGPNWEEQRAKALKRDNYTCRHCGKKKPIFGKNHDVHHIIAMREFGYSLEKNDHYMTANELTNLITLCRKCHREVEAGIITLSHNVLLSLAF